LSSSAVRHDPFLPPRKEKGRSPPAGGHSRAPGDGGTEWASFGTFGEIANSSRFGTVPAQSRLVFQGYRPPGCDKRSDFWSSQSCFFKGVPKIQLRRQSRDRSTLVFRHESAGLLIGALASSQTVAFGRPHRIGPELRNRMARNALRTGARARKSVKGLCTGRYNAILAKLPVPRDAVPSSAVAPKDPQS